MAAGAGAERGEGGRAPRCGCNAARSGSGWSTDPGAGGRPAAVERFEPDVIVTDASMWGPGLSCARPGRARSRCSRRYPRVSRARTPAAGVARRRAAHRAPSAARARVVGASATLARGPRRVDALRADHGLGPLGWLGQRDFCGRLPLYLVGSLPSSTSTGATSRPACATSDRCCGTRPSRRDGRVARAAAGRPPVGPRHRGDLALPGAVRAAGRRGGAGRAPRRGDPHRRAATGSPRRSSPAAPNVHVRAWLSHGAAAALLRRS